MFKAYRKASSRLRLASSSVYSSLFFWGLDMTSSPKPWDRPNSQVKSTQDACFNTLNKSALSSLSQKDQNLCQIYAAIGEALSVWSEVETMLSRIYSAFFAETQSDDFRITRRWYASFKMFGSMPSTAAKIAALQVVCKAYFITDVDKEEREYLEDILNLIEKFCARRNDIAHGVVKDKNGLYYLVTPHFNTKLSDPMIKKEGYKYGIDDVLNLTNYLYELLGECFFGARLIFPQSFYDDVPPEMSETSLAPYVQRTKMALRNKFNLQLSPLPSE